MKIVTLNDPDMVTVVRGLIGIGRSEPFQVAETLGIGIPYATALVNEVYEQWMGKLREEAGEKVH